MTTWEQLIIHALRHEPALCRVEGLSDKLFDSSECRNLFAGISDTFEDEGADGSIDLAILSKKTGVPVARIAAIEDGCYFPRGNNFRDWIHAQAQEQAKGELLSLLGKEADTFAKTGTFDSAKVAQLEELFGVLKDNGNGHPSAPLSRVLSDVEAKAVPWLWPDFIPLGRASLICGDPGSAKTFYCLDLASRLSRGLTWADGSPGIGPARTVYLTVEDDANDTVRPRVDSLGGDPAMISVYNADQPLHLDLSSAAGLKRLEDEIVRLGNVRLVVVDPIIDFSGDVNPNTTEEVRALLTPLIQVSARNNFALVLIGHLNKAQALSAIYRAGGTTSGWLGKCRAAFMIFRDADDKPLRHVVPLKANLARRDPAQLEFRLADGQLDIRVSDEEIDPDEQLNPQRGPSPKDRDEAVKWLHDYFIGRDEVPATEVETAARAHLISPATLRRAKKAAGYESRRRNESDGRAVWVWARGSTCS